MMTLLEDFKVFRSERVRELRWGYTEVMNEYVLFKEIEKAYRRWAIVSDKKRLALNKDNRQEFKNICDDAFGIGSCKENETISYCRYYHIRIFLDEDDLEEFDEEHKNIVKED